MIYCESAMRDVNHPQHRREAKWIYAKLRLTHAAWIPICGKCRQAGLNIGVYKHDVHRLAPELLAKMVAKRLNP